jgi:hypothetical protein
MRKLMVMMIVVGAVGYYIRTSSPDSHVLSAGLSGIPAVAQVQSLVATLLPTLMPGTQTANASAAAPARAAPAMPNITTTNGTYNGATNSGSTNAGGAGVGGLVVPPELTRFVNPSLLTSNPTGTQNLSPASQAALQQIITQARANPAAFKDQLNAVARQVQGAR